MLCCVFLFTIIASSLDNRFDGRVGSLNLIDIYLISLFTIPLNFVVKVIFRTNLAPLFKMDISTHTFYFIIISSIYSLQICTIQRKIKNKICKIIHIFSCAYSMISMYFLFVIQHFSVPMLSNEYTILYQYSLLRTSLFANNIISKWLIIDLILNNRQYVFIFHDYLVSRSL